MELFLNKLLPLFWLVQLALALIPGVLIGWLLGKRGWGFWATVLAAELLMVILYLLWIFVIFPIPWLKQTPSATWADANKRAAWFVVFVHMTRFVPSFVAVRLGNFFGRRTALKVTGDIVGRQE